MRGVALIFTVVIQGKAQEGKPTSGLGRRKLRPSKDYFSIISSHKTYVPACMHNNVAKPYDEF